MLLRADWLPYALGFLLNWGFGVFFPSSSLIGASFDDFTLFESEWAIFCMPVPTIVIGKGWKSNWWIDKKTYDL